MSYFRLLHLTIIFSIGLCSAVEASDYIREVGTLTSFSSEISIQTLSISGHGESNREWLSGLGSAVTVQPQVNDPLSWHLGLNVLSPAKRDEVESSFFGIEPGFTFPLLRGRLDILCETELKAYLGDGAVLLIPKMGLHYTHETWRLPQFFRLGIAYEYKYCDLDVGDSNSYYASYSELNIELRFSGPISKTSILSYHEVFLFGEIMYGFLNGDLTLTGGISIDL